MSEAQPGQFDRKKIKLPSQSGIQCITVGTLTCTASPHLYLELNHHKGDALPEEVDIPYNCA